MPIGGALIGSSNSLIYVNQSQRRGVSTNCFASLTVDRDLHCVEPNRPHKLGIALASAKSCFVNEDMALLLLKTGAIYSVHLRRDQRSSNTVTSLYLTRVASTKSSMCYVSRLRSTYEDEAGQEIMTVFCGSRLGSSLVLQIRRFGEDVVEEQEKSKDDDDDNTDSKMQEESDEDAALYGYDEKQEQQRRTNQVGNTATLTRDSFTVTCVDEIRGLGPVSDLTVGHVKKRKVILEEEKDDDKMMKEKTELNLDDLHRELVLCAGQGRSGGLRVVSNGVRPSIIETFRNIRVSACWSLRNVEILKEQNDEHHKILVLRSSVSDNTAEELLTFRVLSNELRRVNASTLGLSNDGYTVGIHDLQLGITIRGVVQVTRNRGIRFVDMNSKSVTHTVLSQDEIVTHSFSISSHLHLRYQSGRVSVFALTDDSKLVEMIEISNTLPISITSTMFRCSLRLKHENEKEEEKKKVVEISSKRTVQDNVSDEDEEDENYLYGKSNDNVSSKSFSFNESESRDIDLTTSSNEDGHVYVAVVCSKTQQQRLEIYDLSGSCVFSSNSFGQGHSYLYDDEFANANDNEEDEEKEGSIKNQENENSKVIEICVSSLRSSEGSATCLVARLENGLHLIYRFVWRSTKNSSRLLLLRRVRGAAFHHHRGKSSINMSIFPFSDVVLEDAAYPCNGIFCSGTTTSFFLSLQRGRVVTTKMLCPLDDNGDDDDDDNDNNNTALLSFHAPFVNRGFVMLKRRSENISICRFETLQSDRRETFFGEAYGIDSIVNVRHINLGCTVHKILYLGKHGVVQGCSAEDFVPTYILAVSYRAAPNRFDPSKVRKRKRNEFENEDGMDEEEKEDDAVLHDGMTNELGFDADESFTTDEQFELQIVLGDRWRVVKRFKLEKSERIVTMKCLMLRTNINALPQAYIVVGTSLTKFQGEDAESQGRLLLYRVEHVRVTNGDDSYWRPNLVDAYEKTYQGPVSAISHLNTSSNREYIVVALGPKIYVYQWERSVMKPRAFFDGQVYVHTIRTLKSFIMIADFERSVQFMQFSEENLTLSLIARDFSPLSVYAADFFLNETQMSVLISDSSKNLQIMKIDHSAGGIPLPLRAVADFNLGAHVNAFSRCASMGESTRFASFFATLDGSIGVLVPIEERVYKRLERLKLIMSHTLPHDAAMNPEAFRHYQAPGLPLRNARHNIVDGSVVWRYRLLNLDHQIELAKLIGSKRVKVLKNLSDVDVDVSCFV